MTKLYRYKNKTYPSVKALAKELRMNMWTLVSKIRRNGTGRIPHKDGIIIVKEFK